MIYINVNEDAHLGTDIVWAYPLDQENLIKDFQKGEAPGFWTTYKGAGHLALPLRNPDGVIRRNASCTGLILTIGGETHERSFEKK